MKKYELSTQDFKAAQLYISPRLLVLFLGV
jgi:hypothetical protein